MTTPPEQPTPTTDDQLETALVGPEGFSWGQVISNPREERALLTITPPDLGPLVNFTGTFRGHGFNQIFRPQNPATPTDLPTAVPASDNVLELNLTEEFLSFTKKPISTTTDGIPNRGEVQGDIFLNGVGYLQVVSDITPPNPSDPPVGIHFELGIWAIVPPTTDPFEPGRTDVDTDQPGLPGSPRQTLNRMGSIPHGTTINAQGTFSTVSGPPTISIPNGGTAPGIPPVDITPFVTGSPTPPDPQNLVPFPSQTATNSNTARIPQDLTGFIGPNGITAQQLLDNPNTLLNEVVLMQSGSNRPKIVSTTTISITTNPRPPGLLFGGGADNIAFLLGDPSALTIAHEQQQGVTSAPPPGPGPNAQALSMDATFWIETVESDIVVPPTSAGETKTIPGEPPLPGVPAPVFQVTPPIDITQDTTITVQSTQIQYSQVVFLVFGRFKPLTWPHVSVNTLVPFDPIVVDPSVFQ
jgi:hypothetical protein